MAINLPSVYCSYSMARLNPKNMFIVWRSRFPPPLSWLNWMHGLKYMDMSITKWAGTLLSLHWWVGLQRLLWITDRPPLVEKVQLFWVVDLKNNSALGTHSLIQATSKLYHLGTIGKDVMSVVGYTWLCLLPITKVYQSLTEALNGDISSHLRGIVISLLRIINCL